MTPPTIAPLLGHRRAGRTVRTIEEAVQDMKPLDAVDYLLEAVRNLSAAQDGNVLAGIMMHGFEPGEARLIAALDQSRGRVVSVDSIHERIYAGAAADLMPGSGVVASYVCKVRRKFRQRGYGAEIATQVRFGYRILVRDGWRFPWELAAAAELAEQVSDQPGSRLAPAGRRPAVGGKEGGA